MMKWLPLALGLISLGIGIEGLITGEAVEPRRHSSFRPAVTRTLVDDEAAFSTIIFWYFLVAIVCFLGVWLLRWLEKDD